jgi:hypothetical protein
VCPIATTRTSDQKGPEGKAQNRSTSTIDNQQSQKRGSFTSKIDNQQSQKRGSFESNTAKCGIMPECKCTAVLGPDGDRSGASSRRDFLFPNRCARIAPGWPRTASLGQWVVAVGCCGGTVQSSSAAQLHKPHHTATLSSPTRVVDKHACFGVIASPRPQTVD